MPLLVTSAAGANGNGYGALLAFDLDGRPLGFFSNDSRIADPRGLAVDAKERLLFLNSGADRVLALDPNGRNVRDTGSIEGLNPGGGNIGPDGRYYVGLRRAHHHRVSQRARCGRQACPATGDRTVSPRLRVRPRRPAVAAVMTIFSHSLQPDFSSRPGWLRIMN
jgi:hypothetical protein